MKKAIVLSSPGQLTAGGHATRRGQNTARSPGSQMVAEVLRNEDYDTINIEYIHVWLQSREGIAGLTQIANKHFANSNDCVIALSMTVGHHALLSNESLFTLIDTLKKSFNVFSTFLYCSEFGSTILYFLIAPVFLDSANSSVIGKALPS